MIDGICTECGRVPTDQQGNLNPKRWQCWDCDAYTDTRWEKPKVPAVIFKASYQDSRSDKRKRILALPSSHPDAFPENANDANRKMKKHGIDPETGNWTSEEAKNKAVSEAYSRPQPEKEQ